MSLFKKLLTTTLVGAVAAGVAFTATPASATPTANDNGFIPYGTSSLLQAPLPANAPVSKDNAYFLSWEKANEPANYWKIRGTTATSYGMNFARGLCTDPVFKLPSNANIQKGQDWLITTGFHAPTSLFKNMPQNNDSPVVIQDECARKSIQMSNVLYNGTQTLASGGDGTITGSSDDWKYNGLDYRAPSSNSPDFVSATSRGRMPDGMFARDYLLTHPAADGTLGYSPEVFFMETNSAAGFQEPMVNAESGKAGCGGAAHPTICAEGQYVRINPAKVFPSTCTGPALVLAKTLQKRGGWIGDNSGSGSGIKGEQGTTTLTRDALQPCMTLNDLQLIEKGYVPPHQ